MNYRSFSQLNDIIIKNLHKVPNDIDLVVGIPRSGIIPADLIALYKNIPFVSLNEFDEGKTFSGGERIKNHNFKEIKKVLVVDDSLYSGKALAKSKDKIEKLQYDFQYIYAAIYIVPESIHLIDIYFEMVSPPRVFQWNIMHHPYLTQSCVDIDGVLCLDPTEKENDDGPLYEFFLNNAIPYFTPTIKIHTIVSCRLEKYRKHTENWLSQHNIQYDNLVLLDLPDKETRIKWNRYGEYKADVYQRSGCMLFIESSVSQASIIAHVTGKPVFCIENFHLMEYPKQEPVKQTVRKFIGKFLRKLKLR